MVRHSTICEPSPRVRARTWDGSSTGSNVDATQATGGLCQAYVRRMGTGVREIRIRDGGNAYRAIYAANIGEAIHVLHVFTKKSRMTKKTDIDTASDRFKALRLQLRQDQRP